MLTVLRLCPRDEQATSDPCPRAAHSRRTGARRDRGRWRVHHDWRRPRDRRRAARRWRHLRLRHRRHAGRWSSDRRESGDCHARLPHAARRHALFGIRAASPIAFPYRPGRSSSRSRATSGRLRSGASRSGSTADADDLHRDDRSLVRQGRERRRALCELARALRSGPGRSAGGTGTCFSWARRAPGTSTRAAWPAICSNSSVSPEGPLPDGVARVPRTSQKRS